MRRIMSGVLLGMVTMLLVQGRLSGISFGTVTLDEGRLQTARSQGRGLRATVVGIAQIPDDLDPELAAGAIERLTVIGTLIVPATVHDRIGGRLSVVGSIVLH